MAGQYATANPNAPKRVRVYTPADLTLLRVPIGGTPTTQFVTFGYPNPDARIMLSLAILFYQEVTGQPTKNVVPFDPSNGNTRIFYLSLQEAGKAPTGAWTPHTNLVGAGQSLNVNNQMQQIPVSIDSFATGNCLDGFSLDIQGGHECVLGMFAVSVTGAFADAKGIVAIARARYNLINAEMCDDEWESAKQQMSPFQSPAVLF